MTGSLETLHLAELLCARLCHDLSGIAGVLDNALDRPPGGAPPPAEMLDLARDAAAELAGRLRLLRAAWGPADEPLTLPVLRALGAGLPRARRVALDLDGLPADIALPPDAGRLVLNILLLGVECLPFGGTIRLVAEAGDLTVVLDGRRAAWPDALAQALDAKGAGAGALADPRALLGPLVALLARHAGQSPRVHGPASGRAGPWLGPIRIRDK